MTSLLEVPPTNLGHLISMSDARGVFEHALFRAPRPEHGYCSDDMARVLVVAVREQGNPEAHHLASLSVHFLADALDPVGHAEIG